MSRERYEHGQVGLVDVEGYLRDIQDEHCCNVTVKMTLPVGNDTPVLFWVGLFAEPRIVGRKVIRAPLAVQHRWPCVDHKTLAGLLFALAYKLDRKLDEQGHVPAEQATFDWD